MQEIVNITIEIVYIPFILRYRFQYHEIISDYTQAVYFTIQKESFTL